MISCCQSRKIFGSSWRWLLCIVLLAALSNLVACRGLSVSTERNLNTLSPQELSLAFAKAALVDNDRTAVLRFVSPEMEISVDSLLDMVGGSVDKVEDLKVTSKPVKAPGNCFVVQTKATASSLVKEVTLLINMNNPQERKISSFSAQIKNTRNEVIEL